ncbi:Os09g0439650 [Oryza sativa Japonica Group]|uniref:Os09g0439650 protein n=1 Tax=Oryza sativa subsp. japonica TaxID=39947 RepID=A0A0P0XMB8_ORYSJ|nr:Os09g0439650 [Oryza sativa Japonica Group]
MQPDRVIRVVYHRLGQPLLVAGCGWLQKQWLLSLLPPRAALCSAHGTHGRRGSRVVALSSPSPRRCLCCCLLSRQGNSSGACPPPLNLKLLTNGDMFYGDRKASEMKRLHLTKY